tara:strand:+ start:551 stop:754 length:204 start_codon:yes stop_codon:yes gene_type:complete
MTKKIKITGSFFNVEKVNKIAKPETLTNAINGYSFTDVSIETSVSNQKDIEALIKFLNNLRPTFMTS